MNTLYQINNTLTTIDDIDKCIVTVPSKIYSYLIRKVKNAYKTKILICSIDNYNTIDKTEALKAFITAITCEQDIMFKQPSLDIQIEMYTPYVHMLAREQKMHWEWLEYEDLVQMCYLSMCKLYKQGYYLNNLLLRTTYVRDVLQHIRKDNTEYDIVSIDERFAKDNSLSIADTIEDVEYSNRQHDKELLDEMYSIYTIIKDIIVSMLGERRAEQFIKEYANRTTSNANTQNMVRLKRELHKRNITLSNIRSKL